jgi:hypothetical protein
VHEVVSAVAAHQLGSRANVGIRAASAPVRLHRILAPASDAKGQSRNGVDADEVARRPEHAAGPEVLVLRQVAELHNRLVVEVERHLRLREARARIRREQGRSREETERQRISGLCT